MKKIRALLASLLFCSTIFTAKAQSSLQFNSLDSVLSFAEKNSTVIKSGNEQAMLAKWTKIAALGNTINLKSPISATWTDNTQLPVNYIPAEALGGPSGTIKKLSFGQTYVSNYGITPQIDLINLSAWAKIKSAGINEELTASNNLLAKKNLYEAIAMAYFNIVSLEQQLQALLKMKTAADSIAAFMNAKAAAGIIREQDKNNAEINALSIEDKKNQVQLNLEEQYNALKVLCDLPSTSILKINQANSTEETYTASYASKSNLIERQQQLQEAYLKNELRSNRLLTFAPTVSFIFNQSWQRSSNTGFFDADANHFSSQYIGLKLSVPLPFDVSRLSQNYNSKINYSLAQLASKHAELQNSTNNIQLDLEAQKALQSSLSAKKIAALKKDNYQKSLNQYAQGILSSDNLLLSFIEAGNAELTAISAHAQYLFSQSKIKINNTVQ